MKNICPFLLAGSMMLAGFALSGLDLVRDGEAKAVIRLSKKAAPPEERAARELKDYIKKVTGAELPKKADTEIIIGTDKDTAGLPAKITDRLKDIRTESDAFYLLMEGNKVYIIGNKPLSALYGTYEFIERFLQVRWFYPTEEGEDILEMKTVAIDNLDEFQQASFDKRVLSLCSDAQKCKPSYEWVARMKESMDIIHTHYWDLPKGKDDPFRKEMGGPRPEVGGHVGIRDSIIPDKLFAEHPEYFAMKRGKRTIEPAQLNRCFSNPTVRKMIIDYFLKKIKEDPSTIVSLITEDAGDAFCECPECEKMGLYNGKSTISVYMHRFYKEVADTILAQYPDTLIVLTTSSGYKDVPEDPSLVYKGRNLYEQFCDIGKCYAHEFSPDQTCNEISYNDMKAWQDRAPHLGTFGYHFDTVSRYSPMEYEIARDNRHLKELGVGYLHTESTFYDKVAEDKFSNAFGSRWEAMYVFLKTAWNVNLDIDQFMSETYDRYYGAAAPVMKKYHALRRKLWENAPGHYVFGGAVDRSAFAIQKPGAEEQLLAYLSEAEKIQVPEKIRKRIAKDRYFLQKYWIERGKVLKKQLQNTKKLTAQKVVDPIKVDGRFTEITWDKAQAVTGFLSQEKNPVREDTSVALAYDKDNLYFSVICDNSQAHTPLWTYRTTMDDASVCGDDSLEIQLVPPGSDVYYHLIMNTKGVLYDAKVMGKTFDVRWNSGAEIKTVVNKSNYTYEIRIPVKSMVPELGTKPWKIHVMRTTRNLIPPADYEWSSFDGLPPFSPDMYRNVLFGNELFRNANFAELEERDYKGQKIQFPKYVYVSGDAYNRLDVIKTDTGNRIHLKGAALDLSFGPPKGHKPDSVYQITVRAGGSGKLSASFFTKEGYWQVGKFVETGGRNQQIAQKYDLTPEFRNYTFTVPYIEKEGHFAFMPSGTNCYIDSVSAVLIEK